MRTSARLRFGGGRVGIALALRALVVLAVPLVLPACEKVTAESIERWKGTVKGPDKLQEALNNGSVDPELRARTAIALHSVGKAEVVASSLKSMSDKDRSAVVSALVKIHAAVIKAGGAGSAVQDARDGLFAIRLYTSGAERSALDEALMLAVEQQMTAAGKMGGSQSLSKIVEALGEDASPLLVKLMALPKAPHAELADLLSEVGDAESKSRAGDALLAVAKKTHALEPGIWRALGLLASPAVVKFLQEHVDKTPWQRAEQASRALALQPHPELGDFALTRASNPKLHGNVREEMFGLAGTCCGKGTLPGLIKIIGTAKDPVVKYRAYDAILQAAGPDGIDPGLEAFSAKASYKVEDIDDFLVKGTVKLGAPARTSLLPLLNSPSVFKRFVAVLCLATLGKAEDARKLRALGKDKAIVKGVPKTRSVGLEANRVASLLAKGT